MIVKGNTRGGRGWADYLRGKANERVEVLEISGTSAPDDLAKSILEMCAQGELMGVSKTMMAVSINPEVGSDKAMTTEQKLRTADIAEQWLGLEGHRRFVVEHEKKGKDGVPRVHLHVGWERWDYDANKLTSDSFMRYRLTFARLDMETELGHEHAPTYRTRATERTMARNREDVTAPGRMAQDTAENLLQAARDILSEKEPKVPATEAEKTQPLSKRDRFDEMFKLFAQNNPEKVREQAEQLLEMQRKQQERDSGGWER